MKTLDSKCYALGIFAIAAILAGCGGGRYSLDPGTVTNSNVSRSSDRHTSSSGYSVLYNFGRLDSGKAPVSGLTIVKGTLYGTTSNGGRYRHGVIYSIQSDGKEQILYAFHGQSDGAAPVGGVTDVNGTLYGTTGRGGGSGCYGGGCGTIFSISPSGANYRQVYIFSGDSHGAHPNSTLVILNGTLYGTTADYGGSCQPSTGNCGTAFSLDGSGNLVTLHTFNGTPDGDAPTGVTAFNGALYGTTVYGGRHGLGSVFSLTASGGESVIYSFKGGNDVWYPMATVTPFKGKLYGTGWIGGKGAGGRGTVFVVTTSGQEKVVFGFDGTDGANPAAPLTPLNGELYGTTTAGGPNDGGTVFSVTTTGTEKVLHGFGAASDGVYPLAGLANMNGTLFGTTLKGGDHICGLRHPVGCGTVFALTP